MLAIAAQRGVLVETDVALSVRTTPTSDASYLQNTSYGTILSDGISAKTNEVTYPELYRQLLCS